MNLSGYFLLLLRFLTSQSLNINVTGPGTPYYGYSQSFFGGSVLTWSDGSYAFVWTGSANINYFSTYVSQIWLQKYTSDDQPLNPECSYGFIGADQNEFLPSACRLGNEEAVIVWRSNSPSIILRFTVLGSIGNLELGPLYMNQWTLNPYDGQTQVASFSDGNIVIATNLKPNQEQNFLTVYSISTGTNLYNFSPSGSDPLFSSSNNYQPYIGIFPNNEFVIVWVGYCSSYSNQEVWAMILQENLTPITGIISVSNTEPSFSGAKYASVLVTGQKTWRAIYSGITSACLNSQVIIQDFSEANSISSPTLLSLDCFYQQENAEGAILTSGIPIYTWAGQGGGDRQVFIKLGSTPVVSPTIHDNTMKSLKNFSPYIGILPHGGYIIAWGFWSTAGPSFSGVYAVKYVMCTTNSDCSNPTPVCNYENYCIPCDSNTECIAPLVCLSGECVNDNQGSIAYALGNSISYATVALVVMNPSSGAMMMKPMFLNMFLYLRYLEMAFPPLLFDFFITSSSTNSDFPIPIPSSIQEVANSYHTPQRFSQFGLNKGLFIYNGWPKIMTLIVCSCASLFCFWIQRRIKDDSNFKKKTKKLLDIIAWNYSISYLMASTAEMTLLMFVEYQSTSFQSSAYAAARDTSLFVNLTSMVMFGVAYFFLVKKVNQIYLTGKGSLDKEELDSVYHNFSVLYNDYKSNEKKEIFFCFLTVFRAVLFNIILIFLTGSVFVQLFLMMAINCVAIRYLYKINPCKVMRKNIEILYYEALLFVMEGSLFLIAFDDDPQSTHSTIAANILFYLDMILLFGSLGFTALDFYFQIRTSISKNTQEKIAIAPKPQEIMKISEPQEDLCGVSDCQSGEGCSTRCASNNNKPKMKYLKLGGLEEDNLGPQLKQSISNISGISHSKNLSLFSETNSKLIFLDSITDSPTKINPEIAKSNSRQSSPIIKRRTRRGITIQQTKLD